MSLALVVIPWFSYQYLREMEEFLVDSQVFPQTFNVLETRARPLGIEILKLDLDDTIPLCDFEDAFGLLIQLPNNEGKLRDPDSLIRVADVYKCMKIAVVDPMAQVLMKPVDLLGGIECQSCVQQISCRYN